MSRYFSLAGIYAIDNTIFDNLLLPEELEKDRNNIINLILDKAYNLEVLYADSNYIKNKMFRWSLSRIPSWKRIYKALNENYKITENAFLNETTTTTNTYNNKTVSNDSDVNVNKVSAFNASSYVDKNKLENSSNSTASNDGENVTKTEYSRHGSIGVITPQDMINKEIEIAKNKTIYEIISDDVIETFCLYIY